jgi:hypothetical protein
VPSHGARFLDRKSSFCRAAIAAISESDAASAVPGF